MTTTKKINIVLCSILILGLGTILFFVNPVGSVWMPKCILYVTTGLKCPACGGLRGTHALLHGHLAEAWAYNPLMPLLILLAGGAIVTFWLYRDKRPKLYLRLTYAYLIVYGVWFVVRNLIGV